MKIPETPAHLHGIVTPIHLVIHELDAVLHLLRREQFRLTNHGWKSCEKIQDLLFVCRGNLTLLSASKFVWRAHGPQRCSMQKHPFLCFGFGIQAGLVAAPPSPSWRAQDQRVERPHQEGYPASLHHPWLSLAWWASPGPQSHWQVRSVRAWPWKGSNNSKGQ